MSRRVKTGSAEIDRRIEELLDAVGADEDRDLLCDIVASGVLMAGDESDRLDLKIVAAALAEMRLAFNAFAPYRDEPKVTIFGSARILSTDPLYDAAKNVARLLAQEGWMVITGAGPGIMAAGLEGAGREKSFGVNIRLPFEQEANEFILGDTKLVSMKYFFTRKLELVKESQGFVCLPGGFGTLDETFELLTLQQTGKSVPTPIVFLDEPGGTYWTAWRDFVIDHVAEGGYVAAEDLSIVTITDDQQVAVDAVLGFYRNYRSIRWSGKTLIVRLCNAPTDDELAVLNEEFGDLLAADGRIRCVDPLPEEVEDDDHLELARLTMEFDIRHFGRLHALIERLNALGSAPAVTPQLEDPPRG
jgi:uncharacterized protein (TIGR00730 family)